MNWTEQLQPIIDDYKGNEGISDPEALDGDSVDKLCKIIYAKINLNEGNISQKEADSIIDNRAKRSILLT